MPNLAGLIILLHAAGINVAMRSMEELSPDDWDRLIQINLSSYNVLRLTLKMRPQKKGLIVLINSVAGKRSSSRRNWVQCFQIRNERFGHRRGRRRKK